MTIVIEFGRHETHGTKSYRETKTSIPSLVALSAGFATKTSRSPRVFFHCHGQKDMSKRVVRSISRGRERVLSHINQLLPEKANMYMR